MGRKKEFSDQTLFAAIGADIALGNGGALKAISERTKISIGSIYHRFGSREGLLAQAWVWAVSGFQEQFLAALNADGAQDGVLAGLEAALVTPRFCRTDREGAMILAACRPAEFLGPKISANVQSDLDLLNADLADGMKVFCTRTGKPMALCRFALIDMPLASVQAYLPYKDVARCAEDYVETAYRALMTSSD